MDELQIGDKTYISSKKAAQITGYAKDYVGQLCREGRVEATLVGRNWYVLEAAIRAHRFGATPDESSASAVKEDSPISSTWERPTYKAESVPLMPELLVRTKPVEPALEEESRKTLENMQSAWQDWFSARPKEELLETPEVIDAREELQESSNISHEDDVVREEDRVVPVTLERVEAIVEHHQTAEEQLESEVAAAEPVSLHRTVYEAPISHASFTSAPLPVAVRQNSMSSAVADTHFTPLSKHVRKSARKGSAVAQALLICVIGAVLLIDAIGSGFFDQYARRDGIEYAALRTVSGVIIVNNHK